jgi:hypothetical protein
MDQISKEQWNRLNNEQKIVFQNEIGKKFKYMEYPNHDDILTFLGNNGYESEIKELGPNETPTVVNKGINELWETVINFLINK